MPEWRLKASEVIPPHLVPAATGEPLVEVTIIGVGRLQMEFHEWQTLVHSFHRAESTILWQIRRWDATAPT